MDSVSNIKNRRYFSPTIEIIVLDNQISLTLDSNTPPDNAPGESYAPCLNDNPYKDNFVNNALA